MFVHGNDGKCVSIRQFRRQYSKIEILMTLFTFDFSFIAQFAPPPELSLFVMKTIVHGWFACV